MNSSDEELEVNISAYKNDIHYRCQFPARAKLIHQQLKIKTPLRFKNCRDYLWFKEHLNIEKIQIVYASNYPNNPASVFGHTFLKLVPFKQKEKSDLGQYVVNFAAQTDTESGAVFAFKGLTGLYFGVYDLKAYYLKVREYTYSENRNLFIFDVDIKRDGVERIVDHLWELIHFGRFDYYFFTKNCSYYILELLEVGLQDSRYTKHDFPFVLPTETLINLDRGGVLHYNYARPSFVNAMESKMMIEEKDKDPVLDLEIELDRLNYQKWEGKSSSHQAKIEELQAKIATMDFDVNKRKLREANREKKLKVAMDAIQPLNAHLPQMVQLGSQRNSDGSIQKIFRHRLSLHSIEDKVVGYPQFSTLKMAETTLMERKNNPRAWVINDFTYLSILSLDMNYSWGVEFMSFRGDDEIVHQAKAGGGLSFIFKEKMALYSLIFPQLSYLQKRKMIQVDWHLRNGFFGQFDRFGNVHFVWSLNKGDIFAQYLYPFNKAWALSYKLTVFDQNIAREEGLKHSLFVHYYF